MAKLKNFNGRFCEAEYENVFITLLENVGWQYKPGDKIERKKDDVLIKEDFLSFIHNTNPDLTNDEVLTIFDTISLIGSESDFKTLHKVYNLLVNGMQFTPQNGLAKIINLIDFDNPHNNIFKVVNQLTVEYTNNGQKENRRPDVMLYINGVPLCIIELKNPTDEKATILTAWEQINIRYWRDIPHLLHYCPLACICDGEKTRLGTVRTPYEHFYSWRRVNDGDKVSTSALDKLETMINGVYEPTRFLEIFRDYIYFQDEEYDREEVEIVCRYPQFFASRLLKQSVIKAIQEKTGKGGTYFGATGCGKTYTMAFLARQLSLRCSNIPQIGSPTVILIVDREDLQNQGSKLFTKSKEFLNLGDVNIVKNRAHLRQELGSRQSGGFYICTIQKFCDRDDDKIGLINERQNIVCFSDEAHRTQIEKARQLKLEGENAENPEAIKKALLSKPYAKVLKEAFPHATFVGFTGTPIAETYSTFGDEIDRYTMDQAVADNITVPIKYHPRIAKVLFDKEKINQIEDYYKKCAKEGATKEDIIASKNAMTSMEVILGEKSRLERLATDIHDHYVESCAQNPERIQKAMVVCSSRKIAYDLLCCFEEKYPQWFELKKVPDDTQIESEELKKLKEVPFIAMVASNGKNDKPKMYEYLGGVQNDIRSSELDAAFKQEKSNFRIVIVVDMWITGFDVPCLTYLYNDKPLKNHLLIQTISRVNRKYPDKKFGMVIDYIGIRNNMREAMKLYGGDTCIAPNADDVEKAASIFRDELGILKQLFTEFDFDPFLNPNTDSIERYKFLQFVAEFIFNSTTVLNAENRNGSKKVSFKTYFLKTVKRMRAAFDICMPAGFLEENETALAQCFMAIAGIVRKMSGTDTDLDTDSMNRQVSKMVEEALKYSKVESVLENGVVEDITAEYFDTLVDVKLPATKLELLIKLLKKKITEYGKTNKLEAKKFQELLQKTIDEYHDRKKALSEQEAGIAQKNAIDEIIKNAREQAIKILNDLNESKSSFKKLGLTFEEKAFYDILIALRDQYNFEYGEDKIVSGIKTNDKCKILSKKVKEIIDTKSSYADWLNNQNVRNQLKLDIKICLVKNGYPPTYSSEVFSKVMEQVENFEEHSDYIAENSSSNLNMNYEDNNDYSLYIADKDSDYY